MKIPSLSLRGKVIITVFLVYVIVIVGFVYPFFLYNRRMLEEEAEYSYSSFTRLLAASVAREMAAGNILALKNMVAAASREKCIVYALIQDPQNRVLVSTQGKLDGQILVDDTSLKANSAAGELVQQGRPPGGFFAEWDFYRDIVVPVKFNGKRMGVVRIGMSTEEISELNSRVLSSGLKVSLIAALIGAGLAFFADRRMRGVLKSLISSTRNMAKGDLSQKVDIRTGDELEELGASFNRMAQSLREREEEIRNLKEYNENIVSSITDGILVANRDLEVEYWNKPLEKIYGKRGEEAKGQNLFQALGSKNGENLAQILPKVLQGECCYREMAWGEYLYTSEAWFPLRNSQEEIIGIIARITDVTEKARLEKEIEKYAKGLEQMVEDRTHKLKESQARLLHARTQLMKSERLAALGELAAELAHEIRTPLNSMGINLQILERLVGQGDELAGRLGVLGAEVNRINNVVTDFMRFARPAAPNLKKQDLNKIISEVVQLLGTEATYTGVTLTFTSAKDLPDVEVDRDQIRQVLLNLILNGIQALSGGGQLKVYIQHQSDGFVEIGIVDEGMGIPPEDLERIFNPFFTTKEGGTGLGLSIVSKVVQQHGGHLLCNSKVNQGSTFRVLLPVGSGLA